MKHLKKPLAAAAGVAAGAAVYCSYAMEREDWTVRSGRLPEAFDGLRITILADLHGRRFGAGDHRLLEAVRASRPHYIAICGDLVDKLTDRQDLPELLQALCAIAPAFYVPGNNEWKVENPEAVFQMIADSGVLVLRNRFVLLRKQGQTLVLAGTEDPLCPSRTENFGSFVRRIRETVPGDPYVLMLSHRNNTLEIWSRLRADLVLTGHGHGGVIRLPGVGGLLSVERTFFPRDCEGLYQRGRTTLAVSRGVGGARLWNRPHLPTVVLRHGG